MIDFCIKLREVTWLVFAPNLKSIHIANCHFMQEIISARKLGEVPELIGNLKPFAKLQYLHLRALPSLKSIYWNALPFPYLEEIDVYDCSELKMLPFNSNSVKESKIIVRGKEQWGKQLKWEDEAALNAFSPHWNTVEQFGWH